MENEFSMHDKAITAETAKEHEASPTETTESSCKTCGTMKNNSSNVSYVYAIGRIQPRFPRPSVEKELAQVIGRGETIGLTDKEALKSVLSQKQNRYLARQICWVFTIEGIETYIVVPRDPIDIDLLIDTLRSSPRPTNVDVIIGIKGPLASPEMCNGLMIPIVALDQIYSFDVDSLIKSIPKPEKIQEKSFVTTAEEVFYYIIQMADNAGSMDEHRALNYLAVRYSAIYATVAEMFNRNCSLTSIQVRASRLSGTRKIVDVIFSFTNRSTDVAERHFTRVDVTEEFPFLVTKMSPYLTTEP